MHRNLAPLLGERHAYHRSAVRIHRDRHFVPKFLDLTEREESDIAGENTPAIKFGQEFGHGPAVDHIGIPARKVRRPTIIIFRPVLELQQVDHEDRAIRAFLHHRLKARRVCGENFVYNLHVYILTQTIRPGVAILPR